MSKWTGLFFILNFLVGNAETRLTRNLPGSDSRGGLGALRTFPADINGFFSTYAEPQALGLAQGKLSRATLADTMGVDVFAARERSFFDLCGNIHSERTMKQQLIQGLPKYLRTDAFVYNTAERSCRQMSTYVAGKYWAAKYVMTLANRGSAGGSSRKLQTSTGPRGFSANFLGSHWDEENSAMHETVAVLTKDTRGPERWVHRATLGARPRRLPRCATCVGHVGTGCLIAKL